MKPEQRTRQEKIDIQLGRAVWSIDIRRLIQQALDAIAQRWAFTVSTSCTGCARSSTSGILIPQVLSTFHTSPETTFRHAGTVGQAVNQTMCAISQILFFSLMSHTSREIFFEMISSRVH
ncbi:MAG: hypothetical protein WCS43_01425 [Verrucomicrobiota bacterium]